MSRHVAENDFLFAHKQTRSKYEASLLRDYRCVIAEIVGSGGESEQTVQQSDEMVGLTADSDWHALSPKEETDLDMIMSQCDFAISNAEKFADQLSRDLSVLDGVCNDNSNSNNSRINTYIHVYIFV